MDDVSAIRLRALNSAPLRPERDYVLYWMVANRRTRRNFALQYALQRARALRRPLVILEALRSDYPWASDRLHAFALQGMADNASALRRRRVLYYPYVERRRDEGKGLLQALAQRAALVVTDDFPAFFIPHMQAAATRALDVLIEAVDSNGLLPLRAADRLFSSAYSFRAFLQKQLRTHLADQPEADPLEAGDRDLPAPSAALIADLALLRQRWPVADDLLHGDVRRAVAGLPIDHGVPVTETAGGANAAMAQLVRFLDEHLGAYREYRNEPEREVTSGLSPYLHFGHIAVHDVFAELMGVEQWTTRKIRSGTGGKRDGWWGASGNAEAFLDELVTWRELGFNFCARRDDYDRFEALPTWAIDTLTRHASDERPHLYELDAFERATTHDPLWNAAQTQLRREGRLHGYLRMLWGKKILEWTRTPQEALAVMIELNNKYALDGRDPNSYNGIAWVLGRYDRPWGPERAVFGTVRYMSSANTARKMPVKGYLQKYAPDAGAA
jgi:deoxyribodipyrimidine photo-lyase